MPITGVSVQQIIAAKQVRPSTAAAALPCPSRCLTAHLPHPEQTAMPQSVEAELAALEAEVQVRAPPWEPAARRLRSLSQLTSGARAAAPPDVPLGRGWRCHRRCLPPPEAFEWRPCPGHTHACLRAPTPPQEPAAAEEDVDAALEALMGEVGCAAAPSCGTPPSTRLSPLRPPSLPSSRHPQSLCLPAALPHRWRTSLPTALRRRRRCPPRRR